MKKYYFFIYMIFILFASGCDNHNVIKNNMEPTTQVMPKFGRNNFQPIVFVADEGLCLLGGYSENKWIELNSIEFDGLSEARSSFERIENVDIDIFKGNESFKFYSKQQFISQINATEKPYYYSSPASCEDFFISPSKVNLPYDGLTIGVNGEWEAIPREVILTDGSYLFDPTGNGENAKLFFEKRKSKEIELRLEYKENFFTVETFFIPEISKINKYVLILDLNGDGNLEVVVRDSSIAGKISIWEIYDNKVEKRLSIDLGD